MERIKIKTDNNLNVEAIPLAKYDRELNKTTQVKKKILFFHYNKFKYITVKATFWLVFVPYKHKLKEIIEVEENEILENNFKFSSDWVVIDSFKSETYEYPEAFHKESVKIKNFLGYEFIYNHNDFICNEVLHNINKNLAILYKELPEILNEEFDEELL